MIREVSTIKAEGTATRVVDSPDGAAWPEIMRRINAQSPGRRLTWKVLAERLDWLATLAS